MRRHDGSDARQKRERRSQFMPFSTNTIRNNITYSLVNNGRRMTDRRRGISSSARLLCNNHAQNSLVKRSRKKKKQKKRVEFSRCSFFFLMTSWTTNSSSFLFLLPSSENIRVNISSIEHALGRPLGIVAVNTRVFLAVTWPNIGTVHLGAIFNRGAHRRDILSQRPRLSSLASKHNIDLIVA